MTESEFEGLFKTHKTPLAEIGFTIDLGKPYTCRANGPHSVVVEFGGERYSSHLSCSITGPFANGKWLVFPLIADAIDPEYGQKLRTTKNSRSTIELIIEFVRKYSEDLANNYDTYALRYAELRKASGIPDFS